MWTVVITAIAVLFVVVFILASIKKLGLRKFLVKLIIAAEDAFEAGQNNEKFNYVFEQFYNQLPSVMRMLVSQATVKKFIQDTFDEIKLALDY